MRSISIFLPLVLLSTICVGQQVDPLGSGKPTSYAVATLPADLIAVDITTAKDNLMSLMQMSFSGGGTISGPAGSRQSLDRDTLVQMMNVIWTTKADIEGKSEFFLGYKLDLALTPRAPVVEANTLRFRLTYIRRQAIVALTPREDFSPDALRELSKEPSPAVASAMDRTVTISNLKQLGTGAMIFLSDYDDYFPYVQSTPQFFEFLYPYLKNREIMKTRNPMGGDFRFNMSLAGVSSTEIASPAETPMFFESVAWPDGRRCVAFADSHVKAVSADEWLNMQPLMNLKLKRRGKPIKVGAPLPNFDTPAPPTKGKKGKG